MIRVFLAALLTLASTGAFAQNLGQAPGPGYVPLSDSVNSWIWSLLNPGGGGTGNTVANMVAFGADPTGVANSCGTPLANALNFLAGLPRSTGILYWPAGAYVCNTRITWSNQSIVIVGDGSGLSTIAWPNSGSGLAGINISQNSPSFSTTIRGLRLQTNVDQPSNNAIKVQYATTAGSLSTTATFRDLQIASDNNTNHYWNNGIYCSGCAFGRIDQVQIMGKNTLSGGPSTVPSLPGPNMNAGLNLNGQGMSPGEASTDIKVFGLVVYFATYGVYISGDSEGNYFTGLSTVAVNHGVYQDDQASSGDPTSIPIELGSFIIGHDCASYLSCYTSKGWGNTIVRGSSWIKRTEGTSDFYAAQLLDGVYTIGGTPGTVGTNSHIFSDNFGVPTDGSLSLPPSVPAKGYGTMFKLGANAAANVIKNNLVEFAHYFADLGPGLGDMTGGFSMTFNTLSNNTQGTNPRQLTYGWFWPRQNTANANRNIISINNLPVTTPGDGSLILLPLNNVAGCQIVPTGTSTPIAAPSSTWCTTPNVGASIGDTYAFSNGAAVTVTDFVNGYDGQRITIVFGDGLTTLKQSTSGPGMPGITLTPPVDWTPASGSSILLHQEDGGLWRQLSRNGP